MRNHDIQRFETFNPITSTAGTVTTYFAVGSRAIMAINHLITGVEPSTGADGDTLSSNWTYSVTGAGGASWVTIDLEAAFEYNTTDDTNHLGGITATTAATVNVGADIDLRIPAGAIVRHTEITAGTVTSTQAKCVLEYVVL